MKIVLLTLLLVSCAKFFPKSSSTQIDIEQKYVSQIKEIQDADGFIDVEYCDSILHTALIGVHEDIEIDITAAETSPGEWLRRPVSYEECYSAGKSRSTISRDMLLGVIWYAVVQEDLDLLERMWDYGKNNSWNMGNNVHSIMNLNMLILLSKAIYKLGGTDYPIRYTPLVLGSCEGFVCHLSALQIALAGELDGSISKQNLNKLDKLAKDNPKNILYKALEAKYITGDFFTVYALILSKYSDSLPTNKNWCDDWPVQRDDNDSGLKPCDKEKQHSGGELLFTLWLMRR